MPSPEPATEVQKAPNAPPEQANPWPSSTPPADLPANPSQSDVAAYAWDQFLALSWPVAPGQRGVPDPNAPFGSEGTTVWESWKASYEVFLPDGSAPTTWNEYGPIPPECTDLGATNQVRVITRVSKSPDAIERIDQAVGGTLTDQHGNLARYELRMNEPEFDFVVGGTLYNVQGQDRLTNPVAFPSGVMEIKAAWRLMTTADGPSVRERFYIIDAWVYTPPLGGEPAKCTKETLGLVGLHVTQKTPSRPQWTWATFEQVDNVPLDPNNPGAGPYSFFDPTCAPAQCPWNQSTQQNGQPTSKPTQVTRVIGLDDESKTANATNQARLKSDYPSAPWQYYELVGAQWPRIPDTGGTGYPIPGNTGNTTMETYLGADSSCVDCHFKAATASTSNRQTADFSFMLQEAKPATSGADQ